MLRNIIPMGAPQEAAAKADEGPVFVTGGPGCGKTQALVGRIAHLILSGARADEILVLTPSRETAAVFEERLSNLIARLKKRQEEEGVSDPEKQAEKPLLTVLEAEPIPIAVRTFQHYASEVLRQIGDTYTYTVWDDRAAKRVISQLARAMDSDRVMPKDLDLFYRWYGSTKLRHPLAPRTPPPHRGWLVLEQRYEHEKACQAALDQHDLLLRAIDTLERKPAQRLDWASTHTRHIIVDGAQDLSVVQYQLLKLLTGPTRSVALAADLRQRVSQRPSADPPVSFLLDHARDVQRHHLPFSYRVIQGSRRGAVNLASNLAGKAAMDAIQSPRIGSARLGGLPPLVLLVDGPLPFLYGQVVDVIRELTTDDPPENVSLIFPGSGFPVGDLLLHLLSLGWPHLIRGTLRTVSTRRRRKQEPDRGVVTRIVHLLRCILNPRDLGSFAEAIAGGPTQSGRPLKAKDQNRILEISRSTGVHLIDACEINIGDVDRRSKCYRYSRFIVDMWYALEAALQGGTTNLILQAPQLWAERTGINPDSDPAWRFVLEAAVRADALGNEDPLRSLGFLLDMLDPQLNSGSAVARDEAVSSQGSGLTLTTVDAARGQGWNHCIVIGLPHQVAPFGVGSSLDTREAEARQRRLYVAATRTRGRMLFIIHGRHGEGADAAKLLVEILGEETEYRNVSPQVPADHDVPREGLGLARVPT